MKLWHVLLSFALVLFAGGVVGQMMPPAIAPPKISPGRPLPLGGPDPAVVRFEFSIVARGKVRTRGTVRITAVIQNIGQSDYVSRRNQQNISLHEVPPGGAAALRQTCQFPADSGGNALLRVRQETRCSWTRAWDSSSPAEGEFPPGYKAMIVYDPDIALDSNPKNDDVDMRNNMLQDSGAKINALFR